MSANRKRKKKQTQHRPAVAEQKTFCQEHPDSEKDEMKAANFNSQTWRLGLASFLISVLALFAYFVQAYLMRKAMRVDQRAWVSVPFPVNFPLNGASIPLVTQVKDSGKTPARDVQGDIIATVFKKGEQPTIGDFSIGHPHEHLYAGAVFPDAPAPLSYEVKHFGDFTTSIIVPDEALRQDIANGQRFIIFYGRITYHDVFGVPHWTQFCTGTGTAILDNLKQCIKYNDFDNNED